MLTKQWTQMLKTGQQSIKDREQEKSSKVMAKLRLNLVRKMTLLRLTLAEKTQQGRSGWCKLVINTTSFNHIM